MAEKEYIEREAALRANCYFCSAHLKDDSPCNEKCADYMKFMEIPAADVRSVVRGEWEEEDSASNRWSFRCSVCGEGGRGYKFNFCPNCGADMREES